MPSPSCSQAIDLHATTGNEGSLESQQSVPTLETAIDTSHFQEDQPPPSNNLIDSGKISVSSCNSVFSLLYFNVRSLLPKIDELRIICSLSNPDIICIVEFWLDSTIDDCEISIQGYSVFCLDRSRHGGGVLIYVKSMFTCSVLFKGTAEFECIIIFVSCL